MRIGVEQTPGQALVFVHVAQAEDEQTVSNPCFGRRKRNQLLITATSSVYTILLTVNGA